MPRLGTGRSEPLPRVPGGGAGDGPVVPKGTPAPAQEAGRGERCLDTIVKRGGPTAVAKPLREQTWVPEGVAPVADACAAMARTGFGPGRGPAVVQRSLRSSRDSVRHSACPSQACRHGLGSDTGCREHLHLEGAPSPLCRRCASVPLLAGEPTASPYPGLRAGQQSGPQAGLAGHQVRNAGATALTDCRPAQP